jgi:peptide/nickel transport system substrate-binding protein
MTARMARLFLLAALAHIALAHVIWAQAGGELRFCLHAEPKTLNPLLVADEPSETIRYITGGVLIRVNRSTQKFEPELAASWQVRNGGRSIRFLLRQGLRFSDGTPFSAADVAFTFQSLMSPELHSSVADSFRSGFGAVQASIFSANDVTLTFPAPVAGMERLFDQVAILSSQSPLKERAVLGPFYIAEHKPGSYLLLRRNPNYWKTDGNGRRLPYLDSIRIDVQQNREIELLRFEKEQIHFIDSLDPEYFERLSRSNPRAARDAGASLKAELLWFNQSPSAQIPPYKLAWFRNRAFRRAVSAAINRDDLSRVVFNGHASPGVGPVSAANREWLNTRLKPPSYDPASALRSLQAERFQFDGHSLRDAARNPVEFSLITNAGNRARERMAAMIQQDLAKLGIRLNIVTLDFPSLIERLARTYQYESCLLGLTNDDLDPDGQMNVWLSSGAQHQWRPNQKSPETDWEAEIDRLMRRQASTMDHAARKACFDRVQEIVLEQAPFIYLVYRNSLAAIAPSIRGAIPSTLRPELLWNVEYLSLPHELASR